MQVASAFSHMLNLHNLSENVVASSKVRPAVTLAVIKKCGFLLCIL